MATAATAVWRIRTGGNALNGAGYDSTTYPGGTDYSQQNAAQLSLGDIACSNNTTLTSTTGGFTSAMVGNAMWIPASGGATAGYYWISGYTDTNTVTLDRTPGTVSGGSCKVGGAAVNIVNLYNQVVAGNSIYIKPTAGNATSYPNTGLDYTMASSYTATSGTSSAGLVRWIGDGGMPTIGTAGLGLAGVGQYFENLYFVALSNGSPSSGIIAPQANSFVNNCIINLNNNARTGIRPSAGTLILNTEVTGVGAVTGSTAPPSYSSGGVGISCNGTTVTSINCNIHHCQSDGLRDGGNTGMLAINCRLWKNAGNGIGASLGASSSGLNSIINCTIDSNMMSGLYLSAAAASLWNMNIVNNSLTNHTQSSMFGINVVNDLLLLNDSIKHLLDYNNVYNNTTNISSNVTGGSHHISVDPGYSSASTGDFTPSNSAMQAGYP